MDRFPILYQCERPQHGWPTSVDWRIVAPFERRAQHNHGQTLKRLAERGGLSPFELYLLLSDRELFFPAKEESRTVSERYIPALLKLIADHAPKEPADDQPS